MTATRTMASSVPTSDDSRRGVIVVEVSLPPATSTSGCYLVVRRELAMPNAKPALARGLEALGCSTAFASSVAVAKSTCLCALVARTRRASFATSVRDTEATSVCAFIATSHFALLAPAMRHAKPFAARHITAA
ncbi:hypothetical protein CCR75_006975 [Bremia lactucae]|uniref:Uncharacterized protein n=1 Tax=Bremia lactucae TaxID=4779 RepID=A0A976FKZ6_BRELC|nr:hypothetical protein CCR75_006975 [Bremia lactucae]